MTEESKLVDTNVDGEVANEALGDVSNASANDEDDEADEADGEVVETDGTAAGAVAKKKKSKRAKLKKAFGAVPKKDGNTDPSSNPASKLTPGMVDQLLEMNPSLKGEVAGMDQAQTVDALKKMDVSDLLTGMVCYDWMGFQSSLALCLQTMTWGMFEELGRHS